MKQLKSGEMRKIDSLYLKEGIKNARRIAELTDIPRRVVMNYLHKVHHHKYSLGSWE